MKNMNHGMIYLTELTFLTSSKHFYSSPIYFSFKFPGIPGVCYLNVLLTLPILSLTRLEILLFLGLVKKYTALVT